MIGVWDLRMSVHEPVSVELTGVEEFKWVLGGSFLQGLTLERSDGEEHLLMVNYDPEISRYTARIFSTGGKFLQLEGIWNDEDQTMEWAGPSDDDVTVSATWVFHDERTREFSMTLTGKEGEVLYRLTGTATRRAQKPADAQSE